MCLNQGQKISQKSMASFKEVQSRTDAGTLSSTAHVIIETTLEEKRSGSHSNKSFSRTK